MRSLSSIILLLGCTIQLFGQSPHGASLNMDCAACHTPAGWDIPFEQWNFEDTINPRISRMTGMVLGYDTLHFNHYRTNFPLSGQHASVDCRDCHNTLVFSEASPDCISCHTDMHEQTVGTDCARCHNPENWLVNEVSTLHFENGFPLMGAHAVVECIDCHTTASELKFDRIGNDCINCHTVDYAATTAPNHAEAGFSLNCIDCHNVNGFDWSTDQVDHSFFPLTKGHEIEDCVQCHTNGNYSNLSSECVSCHQENFNATVDPNHQEAHFPTDCAACHTTDPGWMPAEFALHDSEYFPVYSGAHDGQWDQCLDCHTDPANYTSFTCTSCHVNPETDEQHTTVGGYVYENPACLACHPTGSADDGFDHNKTNFPLTGAHFDVECIACHLNGYQGTPTECAACHTQDFTATVNPDHEVLQLSTDCVSCHTTEPEWMPATFANHNDYYALNGAHAAIANDCAACHNGDYTDTPNTCFGCHQQDYEQTNNPNHTAVQFSTDCATCHSESSWMPATFDHDGQYFPIYSGAHEGEWDQCVDCHSNPDNYAFFSCTLCHVNPETDNQHDGVGGYVYNSKACFACHPTGTADDVFDHNQTNFPLTGAHLDVECIACHLNGYQGTPMECAACHTQDFNQTQNPNHQQLTFSTDCVSCHTTEPDWMPATFANHNDYYALNGAHAAIANDCAACHNGDYTNTPNTCFGCHQQDYNQTNNPNHTAAQFSTDCATCHSENTWMPATFDHDGQYFPIYSGTHQGEWDQCLDCHTNPDNFAEHSCTTCHINPETDNQHNGVGGYSYNTNACLACHPTGTADDVFDHNQTNFPLTGAHIDVECLACHANGYQGTPMECAACHTQDFNQTQNPNHQQLTFSTDCVSCHTTEPDWMPATFANHNDYYALNGAHAAIANDCAACHNGDYTNTPNTCFGCHQQDYNQTNNPNHAAAQFSTDCATCHSENTWMPATFDHDGQYFPIYSGTHQGEWNQCLDCHTNPDNFAEHSCTTCHINPETDNQHNGVGGYSYNTNACLACHPTGTADDVFDHNQTNFPLTGAHIDVECIACHLNGYQGTPMECAACHTQDFNQTQNPNHQQLTFSTDCVSCHTTEPDWMPATFANHNDYYALNGAHAAIANDCAACHNGDYTNTPNTCFGCHQQDYNQTNNPDHQANQFPTDCLNCHSESTWVPSTFDHDGFFPITRGTHRQGEAWDQCTECHTVPSNFAVFSCTDCHEHNNQSAVNKDHQGVSGYSYTSTSCYSCHPRGN